MREDYKETSRVYFNYAAATYDGESYQSVHNDYPDILAELEREPCQDLLDCGCGTGAILAQLRESHPELNLTGIDLAEKMIEKARAACGDSVTLLVGDCERLPFDDASFDAVVCSHSFHHYPHPQVFFDSVYRVLRPGGRLIVRDNTGPWLWLLKMNLHTLPKNNRLYHLGDVKFYNRREMARFLRKAGLVMELFEERPTHKMHCVARKPQ